MKTIKWLDLAEVLMGDNPRGFFDDLLNRDLLHVEFPDIYRLNSSLEWAKHHPEMNSYEHTMLVLTQSSILGYGLVTRFSCLMHDIGKAFTKRELMPRHHGHEVRGLKYVEAFCDHHEVPTDIKEVAMYVTRYHMNMH